MNRQCELRHQAYLGILLGFLLFFIMLALGGCTIYRVQSEHDGVVTKVTVISGRNFVAPDLSYHRDGTDVGFDFKADTVEQPGPSDYSRGATDILSLIYGRPPQQSPVIITPLQPPAAEDD